MPTLQDRLLRLRASRSYAFVLLLVVIGFVFAASAPEERWAHAVLILLQSATLLVALWTSRSAPIGARVVIPVVAIGVAVAQILSGDTALATASGLLSGLLVVSTMVVIVRGVVVDGEINAQSVLGAITVYILIGMLFVFIYTAVAVAGDGPFFAQGTDGTLALRLYFSFVTLATVGYGDYTAATNLGHALSVGEALLGQLYLVTIIGVLVGRMKPRRG
jgi:hypothetical protein